MAVNCRAMVNDYYFYFCNILQCVYVRGGELLTVQFVRRKSSADGVIFRLLTTWREIG